MEFWSDMEYKAFGLQLRQRESRILLVISIIYQEFLMFLFWSRINLVVSVISLSITNKTQRYTIFFITVNALYVSGGFSAHHQELKNCTHSSRSSDSPTLAVEASKLDIYRPLCVQFLSSWWWAEKPPETRRAMTVIKNIVKRCILLVIFKEIH